MPLEYLTLADRRLAYQQLRGDPRKPAILFLGGFASDMTGTKASFLADRCAAAQYSYIRFDYRGNGASDGAFRDGTLGGWLEDTLAVFDQLTTGAVILVGSSMGGWLALKLALLRPDRIRGMVGIAAAPDFTTDLIQPNLTAEHKHQLEREGEIRDGHAVITKLFLDEAEHHLLLRTKMAVACPVHLIQGMEDREVPWQHALRIVEHLEHKDVRVTLIKDGDHRLSRSEDLAFLWKVIESLI